MQKTRTILTIDDDPSVLEAVQTFLKLREYNVVTAQRWTEAIAQLTDVSPDAVLLDLHLPTVQGEALLEFIRENYPHLPVVIISSKATPDEMARLGELGANGFIRKPFDTEDLLVILEQVLLDLETKNQELEPPAPPQPPHIDTITEPILDKDPEIETDDKTPPPVVTQPAPSQSKLPDNISPGSGINNLTRLRPQPKQELRRKRKKKRKGGRKVTRLRQVRNFAIIILIFLAMGYLTYQFRQGLTTNFIGGISFGTTETP